MEFKTRHRASTFLATTGLSLAVIAFMTLMTVSPNGTEDTLRAIGGVTASASSPPGYGQDSVTFTLPAFPDALEETARIISDSTQVSIERIRFQYQVAEYLGDRLVHLDEFTSSEVLDARRLPPGARQVTGQGGATEGIVILLVSQPDTATNDLPEVMKVEADSVSNTFGVAVWAYVTAERASVLGGSADLEPAEDERANGFVDLEAGLGGLDGKTPVELLRHSQPMTVVQQPAIGASSSSSDDGSPICSYHRSNTVQSGRIFLSGNNPASIGPFLISDTNKEVWMVTAHHNVAPSTFDANTAGDFTERGIYATNDIFGLGRASVSLTPSVVFQHRSPYGDFMGFRLRAKARGDDEASALEVYERGPCCASTVPQSSSDGIALGLDGSGNSLSSGSRVIKVGYKTGLTRGTLAGVVAVRRLGTRAELGISEIEVAKGMVKVDREDINMPFGDTGDSGSAVLLAGSNSVLGVLRSGAEGGGCLFTPAAFVLETAKRLLRDDSLRFCSSSMDSDLTNTGRTSADADDDP